MTKTDEESGSLAVTGENQLAITDERETLDLAYLDFPKIDGIAGYRSGSHGRASRALVVLSKCFETDSLKLDWFLKKSLQADGPINFIIIIFVQSNRWKVWQFGSLHNEKSHLRSCVILNLYK